MRGRKPLFRKYMAEEAEKLAELGFTNEEIADFWGRSRRAFQYWLKKHPELLHTLKAGKARADKKVEDSLYKRAQGYEFKEKTYEKRGQKKKLILTKEVLKQIVPDTTAQIFWLKNRRPKNWRDKHEFEHSGSERKPLRIILENANPNDKRNSK